MLEMWFLTVFGLMCSSAAIIPLSLPFAISFSTWISRSDSSARIVAAASGRGGRRAHVLEHLAGDVRRDQRLSDGRRADPAHQILDRRVLQQVAARAGEDRVHHVLFLVGDREHDHARQRRVTADVARGLDAGHPRHVEIHDDDVGRREADVLQRLRAGRRLGDDLHALLLEQVPEPRPEEVVVVDEQHADRVLGCVLDRCNVGQRCLLDSVRGVPVYRLSGS